MILVQGRLFQTAESWASFGELRKEVYMCTWYSGLKSEWMDLKAKVLNYRRAKTLYFSVVSAKYWAKNNTIWKNQQWSEGKISQKLLFYHFTFFCQLCMALSFPIYSIVLWDKTDSLMSFSQFMLKKVLKKRLNFHEKKNFGN